MEAKCQRPFVLRRLKANVLGALTLLRKVAQHPLLTPSRYVADPSALRRIAHVLHGEGEFGDPDTTREYAIAYFHESSERIRNCLFS